MEKIKKYIPYIIILLGSVSLLIRAFYSFCWSDESFYSSTAYRFVCGDRLFFDDWFPTQLSGVVILPFMYLFKIITGSMDGIILFLRILYVIGSFASAVVLYNIFSKDRNSIVAYAVSLMMLFYTHLNIATLSYYNISVQCFLLAMVLVYHFSFSEKKSHLYIAGVLFAISVLALPTMAVVYVLLVAVLIVLCVISSKHKDSRLREKLDFLDMEKVLLCTFVGIAIPAVLFVIFLLFNVSIPDFIKGIPYVLSDEEHGTTLLFPLRKFYISINAEFHKGAYLSYLLICASLIFRKKLMKLKLRQLVLLADTFVMVINALYAFNHTGYIQTALCLFAVPLYILTDKRDKRLFYTVFLSGLIFALVYSYSSNGFLYVLAMGHAISCVAGIVFIYDFCMELNEPLGIKSGFVRLICTAVVCYCLCTTVYLRFVNVYRDAPLGNLTQTITKGPAKGLKTTAKHKDMYDTVYETISTECTKASLGISEEDDGYIFITKLLPFGYMCTDLRVAAPTTWRTSFDSERLREFYELHPEKVPDVVLLLDEEYGTYDTCGDVEYDPNPNANDLGGFLEGYLNKEGYTRKDVACGVIYTR